MLRQDLRYCNIQPCSSQRKGRGDARHRPWSSLETAMRRRRGSPSWTLRRASGAPVPAKKSIDTASADATVDSTSEPCSTSEPPYTRF